MGHLAIGKWDLTFVQGINILFDSLINGFLGVADGFFKPVC